MNCSPEELFQKTLQIVTGLQTEGLMTYSTETDAYRLNFSVKCDEASRYEESGHKLVDVVSEIAQGVFEQLVHGPIGVVPTIHLQGAKAGCYEFQITACAPRRPELV